ncbi:MAG: hypothetical protein WBF53_10215 [Litorimonas sp.]
MAGRNINTDMPGARNELTVEDVQGMARRLAGEMEGWVDPKPRPDTLDVLSAEDMAWITGHMSLNALDIGRPEASVLLRLAAALLTGSHGRHRVSLLQDCVRIIEREAG